MLKQQKTDQNEVKEFQKLVVIYKAKDLLNELEVMLLKDLYK